MTPFVNYESFEKAVINIIRNHQYQPDSNEMLLWAFQVSIVCIYNVVL